MTNKQAVCYAITTAYARRIISADQLRGLLAIYESKEPIQTVIKTTQYAWEL